MNSCSRDQKPREHQCIQGRTWIKNRPGQFPDDLPPYRPSPGKIVKFPKSPFSHVKMTVFYLHPTGPPSIAQMQAWPIRPCKQGVEACGDRDKHSEREKT